MTSALPPSPFRGSEPRLNFFVIRSPSLCHLSPRLSLFSFNSVLFSRPPSPPSILFPPLAPLPSLPSLSLSLSSLPPSPSSTLSNSYRTTSEEKRDADRRLLSEPEDSPYNPNAARRAAEVHRQVRKYARANIKPGMSMTEIANMIEDGTRNLVEAEGFKSGIGFPTGLSRNFVAAHYTPNAGDKIVRLPFPTPSFCSKPDPFG